MMCYIKNKLQAASAVGFKIGSMWTWTSNSYILKILCGMGTVARVSKTSMALLSRRSLVEKLTGKQGTHCIGARDGAKTRGTQG